MVEFWMIKEQAERTERFMDGTVKALEEVNCQLKALRARVELLEQQKGS